MARLTKTQLTIYNAHKAAYLAQDWTLKNVRTKDDLLGGVRSGGTCKELWDEIELRSQVSITSLMMAAVYQTVSGAMDKEMRKGFGAWLTSVGIV